jgi:hypothetical protein
VKRLPRYEGGFASTDPAAASTLRGQRNFFGCMIHLAVIEAVT